MQRFILSGLAVVLMSAMHAPNALAGMSAYHQNSHRNNTTEVRPFNLVSLGYQGYFQNIPSGGSFIAGVKSGKITATTLIQSAIEQGRLSPETLSDRGYINSVNNQLQFLLNSN
jgi:hypothetical protein